MRFIVLGTTEFTLSCARGLLDAGVTVAAIISMPREYRPNNPADVESFASEHGLTYKEFGDINSAAAIACLRSLAPDYMLSSWPRIIGEEVLGVPRQFCIGSHPTALPRNRGRHPLHWLISLGLPASQLSLFRMDTGIDSGNILLQCPFDIAKTDTIATLTATVNQLARSAVRQLAQQLAESPSDAGTPQDTSRATYWRKKTPHDVIIDLRLSTAAILQITRSFGPPYPCAKLVYKDQILNVLGASATESDLSDVVGAAEPGRVTSVGERWVEAKAADGIVRLEFSAPVVGLFQPDRYIHPPTRYFVEHGAALVERLRRSMG